MNGSMGEVIFHEIGVVGAFENDGEVMEKKMRIECIEELDGDGMLVLLDKEGKRIGFYEKLKEEEGWENVKGVRQHAVYGVGCDARGE
ncbi:hypothetical protein [Bacillus altitudinis]|uniref:hypothetical protein n=1 Tax=Bacillus altitudinis TaxID=293387 RepID=UPI0011A97964|nr:hypothetical protein [Bacillus altitudinis]